MIPCILFKIYGNFRVNVSHSMTWVPILFLSRRHKYFADNRKIIEKGLEIKYLQYIFVSVFHRILDFKAGLDFYLGPFFYAYPLFKKTKPSLSVTIFFSAWRKSITFHSLLLFIVFNFDLRVLM